MGGTSSSGQSLTDLKKVLGSLAYGDDAKVQAQLAEQSARVRERLARIRHKVLVMSGKGGVGKSTVTSQLALALARRGLRIGVLDADLNGPSIPHMLGLGDQTWRPSGPETEPLVGPSDIRVASMAFFLEDADPVRYKGPRHLSHVWLGMMETGTLREFLGDVRWGDLDVLLLDMPPGAAADKPPAVLQFMPDVAGAVLVTTGSSVARRVVERSRRYARDLGLSVLGLVENFADLFDGAAEPVAERVLGRIAFDRELARSLDRGEPLAADHPVSRAFGSIADALVEQLE